MNVRQHIKALRILALRLNDRTVGETVALMDNHIREIRSQIGTDERASREMGRDRKSRSGIARAMEG